MNAPDINTIKAQMKAVWMAGDFGQIARSTGPPPKPSSSAAASRRA